MRTNVGTTDRLVRIVAAVIAVVIAFAVGVGSTGGIILLILGVVLAATGLIRFCPLYRILGFSTARTR